MSAEGRDDSADPALLEAMAWLSRLRSGHSPADMQALARWRLQSPENDQAYETALTFQAASKIFRARKAAVQASLFSSRRAFLAGGTAIAASVAGLMMVRPPFGLWPSLADLMADHRTAIGERYAFDPAQGVRMEMNTRTSVALQDRGTNVRIIDGEAYVVVAERTANFIISTGHGQVRSRGGQFNVRNFNGELSVTCISGEVTCAISGRQELLKPGENVRVSDGTPVRGEVDPVVVTAWRKGLLIFRNTPLSVVIAEINRYRSGRIILTDSSVGQLPVVGIFHTGHIDNVVTQIQLLLNVPMTHLPGGVVLVG